jgi:hypothetical protein
MQQEITSHYLWVDRGHAHIYTIEPKLKLEVARVAQW